MSKKLFAQCYCAFVQYLCTINHKKQIMRKTIIYSNQCPSGISRVCDLFGSKLPSRVLCSSDDDDDYYSPTDWDQDPSESDTDYEERYDDLNDWLEYNS